jgi:hypothetical protein
MVAPLLFDELVWVGLLWLCLIFFYGLWPCDRAATGQPPAQPQEHYQQEVLHKEGVYYSVALLLGENDDKLPDAQAGGLSARWRYTTPGRGRRRRS